MKDGLCLEVTTGSWLDLPAGHDDKKICPNPYINNSRTSDSCFWQSQSPELNPSENL